MTNDQNPHGINAWTVRLALGAMLAYAVIRSIIACVAKPFWYDELCTYIVITHPRTNSILECLRHGADGQPPFFYVIEKLFFLLPVRPEISLRMPSILAFCCVLLCVFALIRIRAGDSAALICTSTLFLTAVFWVYAFEARPYALLTAATAAALVCYQRAKSRRCIFLFGVALAFGESVHYYAIFVIGCFAIAEAVFVMKERSIRVRVWIALAAGTIPLIMFWPLLEGVKRLYEPNFWARPTWVTMPLTYGMVFDTEKYAVAECCLMLAFASGALLALRGRWRGASNRATPIYCEGVLVAALTLLPFIEGITAKIARGGFTPRYALPMALVIPIWLSYYLARPVSRTFKRKLGVAAAVCVLMLLGLREGYFFTHGIEHPKMPIRPIETFISSTRIPDLPIVVSSGMQYLQLAYYESPRWQNRFVYMADSAKALKYSPARTDSVAINSMATQECVAMRVIRAQDFLRDHNSFLLYAEHGPDTDQWWPQALSDMGYGLRSLGRRGIQEVYLVSK